MSKLVWLTLKRKLKPDLFEGTKKVSVPEFERIEHGSVLSGLLCSLLL